MNFHHLLLPTTLFLLAPQVSTVISCPPNFQLINGNKCVQLFKTELLHDDAAKVCTGIGGTLATVKNYQEAHQMSMIANSSQVYAIWIGAYCFSINGNSTCFNDDGSGVLKYSDFDYFSPMNKTDYLYGQCVTMSTTMYASSGTWTTFYCDNDLSPYAFFCEVPTTISDPTCKYNYNGNCYLPSQEIPGVTASTTYSKAQSICRSKNSNLVSIHSKFEVDYIKSIYKSTGIPQITLGAQASQPHAFNWVDGSKFDFNYRNPLDNFTGNCLQMELSKNETLGLWTEINCQVANSFLCMRKIVASADLEKSVKNESPSKGIPTHYDLSDPSNCNNTLLMAPGVITSFGYGSSALPGVYCSWHLATLGSHQVGIYFTDFSAGFNINVEDGLGNMLTSIGDNREPFGIVSPGCLATVFHSAARDARRHGFRAVVMQI